MENVRYFCRFMLYTFPKNSKTQDMIYKSSCFLSPARSEYRIFFNYT